MTSVFDGYDEEYKSLTSDIQQKISQVSSYEDDAEKKKSTLKLIDSFLDQANQVVQQMDLEVRTQDPATRRELQKKVGAYKNTLKTLRDDYMRERQKAEREGLMGDKRDSQGVASTSNDQRKRMAEATDKLRSTTDKIEEARRRVAETEEVAVTITDELARNREKIQSTHSKVKEVKGLTTDARRIISRMMARDQRQKLIVYAAVGLIGFGLMLMFYFILFGR